MKTRWHQLIICLGIVFLFSGCGGAKSAHDENASRPGSKRLTSPSSVNPPGWVLGRGHVKFPNALYLTGVGISESNAVSANESARSELAKSITVEIQSKMIDVSTAELDDLKQIISTEVNTKLEGVEIRDGWYDSHKGIYYALAAIDRDLMASVFQSRIKKNSSSLKRHMDEGIRAEGQGDILTALNHYFSGYEKAVSLTPLRSALRVVLRSDKSLPKNAKGLSPDRFSSEIKSLVQNVKAEVMSGGGQEIKTTKSKLEPFIAGFSLQRGERSIPVRNLPVIFIYEKGKGEMEQEKVSGQQGTAETTVQSISSFQEEVHTVSAKLDLPKLMDHFENENAGKFLAPLKNVKVSFSYSINIPRQAGKSQDWNEGMVDLVNQIIINIPPGGNPKVGVLSFKDMRKNKNTQFSRILLEDFKVVLVKAENLIVKDVGEQEGDSQKSIEIAKANELNFFVTGFYRMGKNGLEVRSRLTETVSGNILSSGSIQISKDAIPEEDLLLINQELVAKTDADSKVGSLTHEDTMENLVALKPEDSNFEIKVWTDDKEYQIGDSIKFYVKADESCYLTLFSISANGDATVIFPNPYHKDNYIKGGLTYQIPGDDYGFDFKVEGPSGLERIKAIASLQPGMLPEIDVSKEFKGINRGNTRGIKTIQMMSENLSQKGSGQWTEGYTEIFIYKEKYTRGTRRISK